MLFGQNLQIYCPNTQLHSALIKQVGLRSKDSQNKIISEFDKLDKDEEILWIDFCSTNTRLIAIPQAIAFGTAPKIYTDTLLYHHVALYAPIQDRLLGILYPES